MTQPETIDTSGSVNVDQAAFLELINAEVERQVTDRLQNSIATADKETHMDAIRLAADSVTSQKK